ncbi:hypothetical protein F4693_002242 [Sphingomonas endophytica]|uniref:Imelysin-like domain-containing protein n=1 Tax=Sphingomonas endophytica TaxID=869719 RepID=A0A7X0JDL2_9SPHN|nr:hypothetical protein [Sphingomonas endophytica]MBB6505254.1 hypothetical protein [Sphingomonas endophytica]
MRRSIPLLLVSALLAGCAGNAIRLEAAGAVQRDTRAAIAASARYFDEIEARRRAAAAALVASDPSCLPLTPLRLQIPRDPRAAPAPLCLADGAPAPGHSVYAIDLADSPRAILAPRIALLAAIADYADALAALLEAPKADVAAELTAFADQADRLARFGAFVAGTDLPDINAAAASEQGQSLIALIAFADQLAREARDVKAVRALVAGRGATVDRALAALAVQVDVWGRGAARTADDLYGNALFRSYLRGRADLGAVQREELAARIFAARAAARDGPARAAEVSAALTLAATAQAGLRDALAGRFTPAQRRAAARLNIDRLTRALGLIAALGTPR